MTCVGFLGLGAMGSAVAGRLVAAGHEVTAWNRSPGRAEPIGAATAGSPEAALALPVSFSMLADDVAVEAVLTDAALAGEPGSE
jgi:3-hydroxyisobutyrate dehydrogenase-like beta-hydroxyacid dehydrogenase